MIRYGQEYIAGLFDGEGCIFIDNSVNHRLYVLLQMTDREPLEYVARATDSEITSSRVLKSGKRVYCWSLASHRAVEFLVDILPYLLTTKRREAELVIDYPLGRVGSGASNRQEEQERKIARGQMMTQLRAMRKEV